MIHTGVIVGYIEVDKLQIINRKKYIKESFDIIIKMYPPIIDISGIEVYDYNIKWAGVPTIKIYSDKIEYLMLDWDNIEGRNYYIDGICRCSIARVLKSLAVDAYTSNEKVIYRDDIDFNEVVNAFMEEKYFTHTPIIKIYDENGNSRNALEILKK